MATRKPRLINWGHLIDEMSFSKTTAECSANRIIFRQGQPADSLFYLRLGKVKLSVISKHAKEAIIATAGTGEFFGEGCLGGQQLRMTTATAMTDCRLDQIARSSMTRLIHERHEISESLVSHLLLRNIRYEADLVDRLFNSSERRLARILLLLSNSGKDSTAETVLHPVSQADLARMVGTTRSRVSHFMNKFRKLGFIDYGAKRALTVHSALLGVVLHDQWPVTVLTVVCRPPNQSARGASQIAFAGSLPCPFVTI